MHEALVKVIVATCRRRLADGDCPKDRPSAPETLENVVIELADMIRAILHADERGQGAGYAEAMATAARAIGYTP